MKSWMHASGRVVLLGDACHPMLVCLIIFLLHRIRLYIPGLAIPRTGGCNGSRGCRSTRRCSFTANFSITITCFPRAYERLRYLRTTEMQLGSRAMQKMYHLPTGDQNRGNNEEDNTRYHGTSHSSSAAQVIADLALTDQESNGTGLCIPSRSKFVEWFSYDVRTAVNSWWDEEGQHLLSLGNLPLLPLLPPRINHPLNLVASCAEAHPTAVVA